MRVVAVVQARMGSTRLPGKVLMPLAGEPVIHHVLRRAAAIEGVSEVVLATSTLAKDDPLADDVARSGLARVVRGDEANVASRYATAAVETQADALVRVTGDCPVLDPEVSSRVVRAFVEANGALDYVSNVYGRRTFPRGLDTEVFSVEAMHAVMREGSEPGHFEHVTQYIWRSPARFRLAGVHGEADHSRHRWTLDTPEDYELLKRIFDHAPPGAGCELFGFGEVLDLLDAHPDWVRINRHVQQKTL